LAIKFIIKIFILKYSKKYGLKEESNGFMNVL